MSKDDSAPLSADELKDRGNDAYKRQEFAIAADFYKQASELQPLQPVYLSNLSAAQFESGRYEDALTSTNRALELVNKALAAQQAMKLKLLLRQAKLHSQTGNVDEAKSVLSDVLSIDPTNQMASKLLATLDLGSTASQPATRAVAMRRLLALPRYRPAPREAMEYYIVGHDDANSLLAAQYNNEKGSHPWKTKFRIKIPKKADVPFNFSALFCGIGDARHLLATLSDIGIQMDARKSPKSVRIHLTAIDINPSALARDLIVLLAVQELSTIPTKQHGTNARARELLVMLHYLFWATVMPPSAHKTMMAIMKRAYGSLHACKAGDTPKALDLPWLYIPGAAIASLRHELSWWMTKGSSAVPMKEMIQKKVGTDATLDSDGLTPAHFLSDFTDGLKKQKQQALALLDEPETEAMLRQEAAKMGVSVQQHKAALRKYLQDASLADFADKTSPGAGCGYERELYKRYKILCPPAFADGDTPELGLIFRLMRQHSRARTSEDIMQTRKPHEVLNPDDVLDVLQEKWKINCTCINEFTAQHPEIRQFLFDPFSSQAQLTNSPELAHVENQNACILYDQSSAFFSAVAHGLKAAQGAIRIELLVGDGYQIMDEIRYGIVERDAEFPVEYDRIHLSNVPDYVGGHLHSFTVAAPMLKKAPTAYMTSDCLLNTLIWEGARDQGESRRWKTMADSLTYSYTGGLVSEMPSLFGMRLESPIGFPGDYTTWIRVDAPQLSRARLEQVLLRVFWKTVAPARYTEYHLPSHPRECVNIHVWFRLLVHLLDIGYPAHVIQEPLEAMLSNRMTSNITPHPEIPIPLATRLSDKPKVPVSMAPFLTELQMATALWLPRLGFDINFPLPVVEDFVRYSVVVERPADFDHMPVIRSHKTQLLCFGTPQDMNKSVQKIRDNIVGSFDAKTSLQILSTFEWNEDTGVATFLLPRAKAAEFIEKGYEVAIFDHMFWRVTSKVVPCTSMIEVGNADTWDRSIYVPIKKTRTLSDEDGLLGDLLGFDRSIPARGGRSGGMTGFPGLGLGGFPGLAPGGFPGFPGMPGGSGGPGDCPTQ